MNPSSNLYPVLLGLAKKQPDAQASVDLSFSYSSAKNNFSYSELLERVNKLSDAWHQQGIGHGDRVLWLGQNSARVLESILACAHLGAIFCPVNWRMSENELAFVIEDIEPSLVIWQQQELGESLQSLCNRYTGANQPWVQHDNEPSDYEAWMDANNQAIDDTGKQFNVEVSVDVDEADPVVMLYTAAFAGQPNGALLSHRAIITQSSNYANIRGVDSNSRYLNVGPLFHVATLLETMATFQAGGTNIFIRRAEADVICNAIEQERCNSAFLLPPVIDNIIAYNENNPINIKCLTVLAGRPEWNELITVDQSPWGLTPFGFGQTETFGYATYSVLGNDKDNSGIGAMGKAAPLVNVAMLDEAGNELPAGEVGEIAVSGATVMKEYWRRPELNAQRRTGNWHRCNDLGRIESDGTLSFVGPKQRMIRSGQENIYPVEVESCLLRHDAVSEVAVIGVPDEQWEQSVKAIIVLAPNYVAENVTGNDEAAVDELKTGMIEFCRQSIASYKKPKVIQFVDALPKIGAALDYAAIDKKYDGGGYPGGG